MLLKEDESTKLDSITNELYEEAEITLVLYPWRRYFARSVDLSIYWLLWFALVQLVFRWNTEGNALMMLFNTYVSCGMMLLIEPLLLSTVGTTLGKGIFGLIIRDTQGRKLTYKQASQRTIGVFGEGMGYSIPIYSIVREVKCYNGCKAKKRMSWETEFSYTIKDKKAVRLIAYVALTTVIFGLIILIVLQRQMPLHRGDLTAAQYFENCNDIMSYEKIDYGKSLNDQGEWVDKEMEEEGVYNIVLNPQPLPQHILTISDGSVSKVTIDIETRSNEAIIGDSTQKYLAVMSFLAAQKEMNGIRLYRSGILETISEDFANYSFIEAGVRVTNKVEYNGYDSVDDMYLYPTQGETQYLHMVFTMEKVKK